MDDPFTGIVCFL